ncbi:outer dense fiber protein 3-like [Acyrthosiphon pisum]|uniref:Outer dense fiber protein 3 n=1 Tax=Acyrthosiphon pisum TaxID=7029 RepID=A0A8R2AZL4_ACYPI|nr:outer dense fiber protein 3-like [Acyrthosiphon pisum]
MPKTTDPRFWQSPAYTLRGKNDFPIYVSSPGPVYRVDRMTRHGPYTTAKVDFGKVLDKKFNAQSPGPAAYLPCYPNLKRAPTPKLLLPLTDGKIKIGPSPNAYTLSSDHRPYIKSRRKGYTIKWRTKECGTGAVNSGSPGPAAYSSTNADVYKYHTPAKTFGIPVRPTGKSTKTPHAYLIVSADGCVERCKPKKFTFGVKHPYKHPPYVVPADNCPI